MNNEYRLAMLTEALAARDKEITEYQVNIDNFVLATEIIGEDLELQEFKLQVSDMLSANRLEQKKAYVLHEAIKRQLENIA